MVRVCAVLALSLGCIACGGKPPAPTPPAAPAEALPPPPNPDENRVIDPADNPSANRVETTPTTTEQPE